MPPTAWPPLLRMDCLLLDLETQQKREGFRRLVYLEAMTRACDDGALLCSSCRLGSQYLQEAL